MICALGTLLIVFVVVCVREYLGLRDAARSGMICW